MDVELTFCCERVSVTVGVIMMKKKKKCQQLIWYTATWLRDRLTYNPTGVTLPISLLAKCQHPTWLVSYTVWYPQAALRDTTKVQRSKLTFPVSLKAIVQSSTYVTCRQVTWLYFFAWRLTFFSYNIYQDPLLKYQNSSAVPSPLRVKEQRLDIF